MSLCERFGNRKRPSLVRRNRGHPLEYLYVSFEHAVPARCTIGAGGDNRGKRYGNARRENGLRRGDSSPPAHGSRLTHFEIARLGIPRMQAHLGVIGRFEIERRIASFGNSKSGALPGRQSDRISAVRVRHNAGRLTAAPAAASTPINAIRAPKFSISVPMSKLSTNAPATDGGNPPSAPTAALDWRRISFG